MSDEHRAIYVAANARQAQLIRDLLAQEGIDCFITSETQNGVPWAGDVPTRDSNGRGSAPTGPKLVVHQDDAETALEIIMEAEAELRAGGSTPELLKLQREAGKGEAWPSCPHCARRRLATCPVCATSGIAFPEAFLAEEQAGQKSPAPYATVICTICDEPFEPRFPARCEWCGHRFPDGYEPKVATPPLITNPIDLAELSGRAGILIAAMTGLAAIVLAWFYYVLR